MLSRQKADRMRKIVTEALNQGREEIRNIIVAVWIRHCRSHSIWCALFFPKKLSCNNLCIPTEVIIALLVEPYSFIGISGMTAPQLWILFSSASARFAFSSALRAFSAAAFAWATAASASPAFFFISYLWARRIYWLRLCVSIWSHRNQTIALASSFGLHSPQIRWLNYPLASLLLYRFYEFWYIRKKAQKHKKQISGLINSIC